MEAFGEPAVDRRQQVVGVPPIAPIGPKPGKIAGGSKLEDARRLVTGGGERGVESGLGDPIGTGVASQAGARAQPVQLCRAKVLACRRGARIFESPWPLSTCPCTRPRCSGDGQKTCRGTGAWSSAGGGLPPYRGAVVI